MKLTFTIPSLLFGCVAALPTRNEPTPVPDISGTTVGYSGNGCPQGSVSVAVQPKSAGQSGSYQLVATMNNMTVSGTPEAPRTSVSKNCVIQLYITIPEGWQLSMGADTEVNGYAWLVDESMKLRTLISYEYSYIDSPVSHIRVN